VADTARAQKIADRIKTLTAANLDAIVKDPDLGFVTVTDVRVTGDLQHASLFYTVFGDAAQRATTAHLLEVNKGRLRSFVGKQLGIRLTPSLEFIADAVPETAAHLEDLLKEELLAVKVRKAKGSKNITSGIANIAATFNNTIVSITDAKGNVISWSSAGKCNFRGSRKSTAYAAQVVAQDAARNAMAHGLKEVQIRVSGPGLGRDSAIRGLQAIGLEISSIIDVTPVPHNGCRPPKRRRV